ncbi:MAG: extracellular solute-binding protein [Clostridia bacterium]|nr:extracellular solute-binding protein [Clostridia bacterium]
MKKRVFCSILSAVMLLCAASCGEIYPQENKENINEEISVPENSSEDTPADTAQKNDTESTRTDHFAALPDEDHGGREFIIAATDISFADGENSSGLIAQSLSARTAAIEKKYNIDIKVVPADASAIPVRLYYSESDTAFCDLVYMPMDTISQCAEEGLLSSLYSLPFFDENAEYTAYAFEDTALCGENIYGIYGDSAFDDRYAWCVFYNKYLMAGLGYDVPSLISSGQWTWEKFLEISSAAVADIDKNGRMNRNYDRYGYASPSHTEGFARAVFASFGKKFTSVGEDGALKMDFATTKEDDWYSEIYNICVKNGALYPVRTPGDAAFSAFSEGRLAFLCEKLSLAERLAYLPLDWGVAPMPKRNAEQAEYISHTDSSVCGYAVPLNVSDSVLAGKVLNAIYAYDKSFSENAVGNAFAYYYLRDNASAYAARVLCMSNAYDAVYTYGTDAKIVSSTYGLLSNVLAANRDFARTYSGTEKSFSDHVREKFSR